MSDYKKSALWNKAFTPCDDGLNDSRNKLATAYEAFRERVQLLVGLIHKDMPDLTLHDITHIDALWQTASEIAGDDYPLNPAEAFVLGGAFLLHDAAHCIAAYLGGVAEIRALPEWKDFAAMRGVSEEELTPHSPDFQLVLFDVLRVLHPKQARELASLSWKAPGDPTPLYLLPHDELRMDYGDVIGQVAESHWWSPHELETLKNSTINSPACLSPASWSVDLLKLAVLLRTADAAHIDARRAPRFMFALVQPGKSSQIHWQFQSRMHQVKRDPDPLRQDLRISSSPFPVGEQEAWWLAYDAAQLIDKELRVADRLLLENRRERLAVRGLSAAYSPADFSRSVPTSGWEPVDASIKISNIKSLVERFGGEKLYGSDPSNALRELLQNAIDAVDACRKLGGLGEAEGSIEVSIDQSVEGEDYWLHVTDTGIGMSRYVLTEVLLDFGRSLWRSADLRGEWGGLPASGFEAIGQFGIGFFAVFMLGQQVRVTTRRYEAKDGESDQWLLEFKGGTEKRPVLRKPDDNERLKKHGTRVSVLISEQKYLDLCPRVEGWRDESPRVSFSQTCAWLAPALGIDLYVSEPAALRQRVVEANDWMTLDPHLLLNRIKLKHYLGAGLADHLVRSQVSKSLTPIYRPDGSTAGRCTPSHSAWREGIGVVKGGLRAGNVKGLEGIVFVQPQFDLARRDALPAISTSELQVWAEHQKSLELTQVKSIEDLDHNRQARLAMYGASHSGLLIGQWGNGVVNIEMLKIALSDLSELVVHEGEITYDIDDDVSKYLFDDIFELDSVVLQIPDHREPEWLEKIDDGSLSRSTWSLKSAVEAAVCEIWGQVRCDSENVVVGSVSGVEIHRYCLIYSKQTAE